MSNAEDESVDVLLGTLHKKLKQRVDDQRKKEREFENMKKAFEQDNPSLGQPGDVLRLNVGGTCIDVLRRTLTSVEGSMLASKFSGRWDEGLEKDKDGNFFIDVDINLFLPIINYLRNKAFDTPDVPVLDSPSFASKDSTTRKEFLRMLEYYNMSLGIYPFGIFVHGNDKDEISSFPDYSIEAAEYTTFHLLPLAGNTVTKVRAFEVELGAFTVARIGWMNKKENLKAIFSSRESGVGYTAHSFALDCGMAGIAVGPGNSEQQRFDALDGVTTIVEGDVVRCEGLGKRWFINGNLVATQDEVEQDGVFCIPTPTRFNIQDPVPCFSVMGSLRVSKIEIEYA